MEYKRWQVENARRALKNRRVVAISGVRQTGKTAQIWFRDSIVKGKTPYRGFVLYSGEDTLSFGGGMLAVPIAALWN